MVERHGPREQERQEKDMEEKDMGQEEKDRREESTKLIYGGVPREEVIGTDGPAETTAICDR